MNWDSLIPHMTCAAQSARFSQHRSGEGQALTPRPAQGLGKASLRSFTLIELLVVIAILAVLAVAVVLVLNPVELIKESRDTTRIEDLGTINRALSYLQVDQTNAFFGTSTIVYVSIPDTTTTCANLGLPSLPSGYTYGCAPTSTYRKADATGWIPLDFFSISYGSPLAKLPIDPVNTTSTGLYYTYIPGGSWELTALMESTKRKMGGEKDIASTDGGQYPELYETGSGLKRTPVNRDPSLMGFWSFEEGTGSTTSTDYSGHGNNGAWYGTSTDHYASGKVGSWAGSFNGVNDYVSLGNLNYISTGIAGEYTTSVWIKFNQIKQSFFFGDEQSANNGVMMQIDTSGFIETYYAGYYISTYQVAINRWYNIVFAQNSGGINLYVNGSYVQKLTTNLHIETNNNTQISSFCIIANCSRFLNGFADDVRIYNRALSAAEIQAIYNATR